MRHVFSLLALLLVVGCAEEGTYPLSGKTRGPEDPVLDLDARDYTVPGGLGTGVL